MRILAVGNMYPPHHFGGYELVWRSATEHLRARGHEVRVLTTGTRTDTPQPDDPEVYRELRWHLHGGRFERVGPLARATMARHNHHVLERHLDELRPDVVMWWSMGGLTLTMLETVRRLDIPAVGIVHDEWPNYGRWADPWLATFSGRRGARLVPIAERLARIPAQLDLPRAARYLFVSEYMRRRAREVGLGLLETGVAHSGIDPEYLGPAPERLWGWRLLYVGRLDPRKGVDVAVEALVHLPPEAQLRVAGGWDEEEERRLRVLAAERGVGARVHFLGQRSRKELVSEYDESDAVLFPVRWDEPWGLVPLEAMARGRPVVATGRGGSAEYLHDAQNCLLVNTDDPEDLATAVRRLAAEPELRARLREGGLATAPEHTEPVFNEQVEQAVEAAAEGGAVREDARRGLSVLHVGTGFRPWRRGGLVAYVEDLAWEQSNRGHDVAYLYSGRHYRGVRGPRLKSWRRRKVTMLEVVNSPLYDHGQQPALELSEPRLERMVRRVIAERRPDVIHVHELAGFPSSLLEVARESGVPAVVTLQDYFPLCSTFKLFDWRGGLCLRRQIGEDCVATTAAHGESPALLFEATLRYDLHRALRWLSEARREVVANRLARRLTRGAGEPAVERQLDSSVRVNAFQNRRDVNVDRLNRADAVVAMSHRVSEIYEQLGVEKKQIRTMRLTLAHVERLGPRRRRVEGPVTFATLGGGESTAKGARLLIEAAAALSDLADDQRLRLLVFGYVTPEAKDELARLPGVELRGLYYTHDLDRVLADVHVGIMPSIWEEAYGYAGVEFLSAGVPVIGNAIGGIVEYVRDGETGWLNRSCTAGGLAQIMREIVEDPAEVARLSTKIVRGRESIVLPLHRHAGAVDELYDEVISRAAARRPGG